MGIERKITFIFCGIFAFNALALGKMDEQQRVKKEREPVKFDELLSKFRSGEEFRCEAVGDYLINGKPEKEMLNKIEKALKDEKPEVAELIVYFLKCIGIHSDPLYREKGGDIIRDKDVIRILVKRSLSKPDVARDKCLDALMKLVPAELLKDYGAQLADNLRIYPDETLLLVVAKLKPKEAIPVLKELSNISYSKNEKWSDKNAMKIAKAALYDSKLEDEFIERFLKAEDPEIKKDAALDLGYIGTRKALKALAGEMRSDAIVEMTGVSYRSIRVYIMEALSYNYPEKTFLWNNAVRDDSGYEKVEKFCEKEFGIKWTKKRPPFLWIQGLPFH